MAVDLRFDSISISNYRQYKSINIHFTKTQETDLHVIIASNGVGKTNLLNSINWCLYGDEPHLGDKEDSLTICNHTALEEAKKAGEKEVEVSVQISTTVDAQKIVFTRTTIVKVSTRFAQPAVLKATVTGNDGNTEIYEDVDATDLVNRFLPQKIRQYFFFDGEQLHNYFGQGQDTSHVKDSIHEIAQINYVISARGHLDKIIEEYQKQIAKISPAVDDYALQIQKQKTQEVTYIKLISTLEEEVKRARETIEELNSKISGTETVVEDDARYHKNEAELEELDSRRAELRGQLHSLVRTYYTLFSMYRINKATSEYIQGKFDKGTLPTDISVDLIRDSLAKHECVLCHSKISHDVEAQLEALINQFEVSTTVTHKLIEIKNDVNRACRQIEHYRKEKCELFDKIREIDARKKKLSEENQKLLLRIGTCSSVEQIGLWIQQREDNKITVDTNNQKIGSYKQKLEDIQEDLVRLTNEMNNEIENAGKCEDIKKQLAFASEARAIVASVENETISEVRSKMEAETMKQFEALIWKKNTYGRIELSENYKLKLFHKITGESCLGSCSAAERELLALAFTIALHKVSGHDCLLFIDTPVGRVSDVNRENFARSLIAVSEKKQLILAFTPSEFSEEIQKYFDENVVSSYYRMISMDEEVTRQEGHNG